MALYVKAFTTVCPSALIDAINLNGAITPTLLQIINTGDSNSTFDFDSSLSAGEETELDDVLAAWVCPAESEPPDNPVDNQDFDDTADSDEMVIWSSEKIENTFVSLTRTVSGTLSITGGGDLSADRTLNLVNDEASPGNDKLYGTNGSGTKGWYDQPGGGGDNVPKPTGFDAWHEVLTFSKSGSIGDEFMIIDSSITSNMSSYPMIGPGQVAHVTVSIKSDITDNSKVVIVKGAYEGGGGQYSGGSSIGSDLIKSDNSLVQQWNNLTGYTFAADDRISVYVKNDPDGLETPIIRVYVRYD